MIGTGIVAVVFEHTVQGHAADATGIGNFCNGDGSSPFQLFFQNNGFELNVNHTGSCLFNRLLNLQDDGCQCKIQV